AGSPRAERSSDPARGWLGSNARLRPGRRADNIANPRSAQELLGHTCEDTLRRTLEGLRSPHGREDQRLSFDPDRRATDVHTSLVMKHERRAWPAEPKFAARMHHRADETHPSPRSFPVSDPHRAEQQPLLVEQRDPATSRLRPDFFQDALEAFSRIRWRMNASRSPTRDGVADSKAQYHHRNAPGKDGGK